MQFFPLKFPSPVPENKQELHNPQSTDLPVRRSFLVF